jgi:hypothetical protein
MEDHLNNLVKKDREEAQSEMRGLLAMRNRRAALVLHDCDGLPASSKIQVQDYAYDLYSAAKQDAESCSELIDVNMHSVHTLINLGALHLHAASQMLCAGDAVCASAFASAASCTACLCIASQQIARRATVFRAELLLRANETLRARNVDTSTEDLLQRAETLSLDAITSDLKQLDKTEGALKAAAGKGPAVLLAERKRKRQPLGLRLGGGLGAIGGLGATPHLRCCTNAAPVHAMNLSR